MYWNSERCRQMGLPIRTVPLHMARLNPSCVLRPFLVIINQCWCISLFSIQPITDSKHSSIFLSDFQLHVTIIVCNFFVKQQMFADSHNCYNYMTVVGGLFILTFFPCKGKLWWVSWEECFANKIEMPPRLGTREPYRKWLTPTAVPATCPCVHWRLTAPFRQLSLL